MQRRKRIQDAHLMAAYLLAGLFLYFLGESGLCNSLGGQMRQIPDENRFVLLTGSANKIDSEELVVLKAAIAAELEVPEASIGGVYLVAWCCMVGEPAEGLPNVEDQVIARVDLEGDKCVFLTLRRLRAGERLNGSQSDLRWERNWWQGITAWCVESGKSDREAALIELLKTSVFGRNGLFFGVRRQCLIVHVHRYSRNAEVMQLFQEGVGGDVVDRWRQLLMESHSYSD